MKKVLIITYYWPPSGGAGVQRWLKFVKYLREFGWEPVVYTPENPEIPAPDLTLEKEIPAGIQIIKQPIWEPYDIYKTFIGRKKEDRINPAFLSESKKPGITEKISVWIRGNFFIPDARKFWIGPSVRSLNVFLLKNPVDAIITTGPPHSMHLIAYGIKKKLGLPWIADFRDLWTTSDYQGEFMLSPVAKFIHRRQEGKVLTYADRIITIGETMKNDLEKAGARNVEVITNGFDVEDLTGDTVSTDEKFSIAHIGTLVKARNPLCLWKILSLLVKENSELAASLLIKLVGKVDFEVEESINRFGLASWVRKIAYMPHREVIEEQQRSQILLLLINQTPNAKGILTGKFFEYLAAGRPVLAIGPPDGDAAAILRETGAGKMCNFNDEEKLKEIMLEYFTLFKEKKLISLLTPSFRMGVEKYSRRELTKQLAAVLNSVCVLKLNR